MITKNTTRTAQLDSLTAKPFDTETRAETVDVAIPVETSEELFFNAFVEREVSEFVQAYAKRDQLFKLDIESNSRLLLYGEPGTGKTSLARYISIQTNLPLVTVRLDGVVSSLLEARLKIFGKYLNLLINSHAYFFLMSLMSWQGKSP